MDTSTGHIYDFNDIRFVRVDRSLVKISHAERRKLARYEEASRPAVLVYLRKVSAERNKEKRARKARRKQRAK